MGIYVNPKNTAFRQARNSKIYVDKSGLISYTNQVLDTLQKNLCVSRPRRFGKSMAADMLAAYYSRGCQSGHLFDGLEVEKDESFNSHLNRHDVIRLDIQQFLFNETHLDIFIGKLQEVVINELRLEFGNCFHVDQYGLPGVFGINHGILVKYIDSRVLPILFDRQNPGHIRQCHTILIF